MKHLNPIVSFKLDLFKNGIFSESKRFSVEKYASLQECAKSVRKSLKRAKSEGYDVTMFCKRQSGVEELLKPY